MKVLIDTTQSTNFEIRSYDVKTLIRAGGMTEWKYVLCEDEITPAIITQLTTKLNSKGYPVDSTNDTLTPQIKSNLTKYQKAANLPIGNLGFETLDSLGIKWDKRPIPIEE